MSIPIQLTVDRDRRFRPSVRRSCLSGPWGTAGVLVVLMCGLCSTVEGQQLLILGQSPSGPLLDDSEPGDWLDHVEAPVRADSGMPGSVVDGRFAAGDPGAANGIPALNPAEAFGYGNGATKGAWSADLRALGSGGYGETVQCPSCGGAFSMACPTCPGEGYMSGGVLSRGAAGLHGLHAKGAMAGRGGLLDPMTQESWLFRPFSAGWFMGFMAGNELIEDWVGQEQGYFGGYRFGWDIDPYWGCETRFSFASVSLHDSGRAKAAQEAADIAAGYTTDDAYFHRFDGRRDSGIRMWDIEMLWYPFGDTYLRPYFLLGLGAARVDFMDRLSERRIKSVFAMPIGIGFKYHLEDWVALRVEATDNFIVGAGSGFGNLHNFSLTAGLEVRFGGTRTAYWPYYPGRHYW